jgi:hypothetical protein
MAIRRWLPCPTSTTTYQTDVLKHRQQAEVFRRRAAELGFEASFLPQGQVLLHPRVWPATHEQAARLSRNLDVLQRWRAQLEPAGERLTRQGRDLRRQWEPVQRRIDRHREQLGESYRELRRESGRPVIVPPEGTRGWRPGAAATSWTAAGAPEGAAPAGPVVRQHRPRQQGRGLG